MNDLMIKDQNYQALVEEIKATITESVHNSRWDLISGYWTVGKLIREYSPKGELTALLTGLAVDIGISNRTLWRALSAFDKYPRLDLIPGGKNISWNKLITKYLTTSKAIQEPKLRFGKCQVCGLNTKINFICDKCLKK